MQQLYVISSIKRLTSIVSAFSAPIMRSLNVCRLMRVCRLVIFATISFGLGCASQDSSSTLSQQQQAIQNYAEQHRHATVMVGYTKGVISPSTLISWHHPDTSMLGPDEDEQWFLDAVKEAVDSQLRVKGLSIIDGETKRLTRFQIVVATGNSPQQVFLRESWFGIMPGLNEYQGIAEGSIMVAIIDLARGISIWRAVVEGAVDPQGSKLIRKAEINAVVASLIKHVEI